MIDSIRKDHDKVLLLDCGDVFDPTRKSPQLRGETIFHAMERMGYDAMNVADADLSFGIEFFNQLSENSSLMTLSATLKRSDTKTLVYRPYLIKKMGKLRFGIIGLTSSKFFSETLKDKLAVGNAQISNEIMALKQLLPEVRRQSDIIILLSHLGYAGTMEMLQSNDVKGIDIAIIGHGLKIEPAPIKVGNTLVVENAMKGEYLGKLLLTIGADGSIKNYKGELIGLGKEVPETEWARKMMDEFDKKAFEQMKRERKEEEAKVDIEKQTELLKLSPAEAIKKLQEMEQAQQKQ